MRLNNMTFTHGDGGIAPDEVTFVMSAVEALLITKMVGCTSHEDREAVLRGGGDVGSEIYNALTGDVWNRYFDDGVDDAARHYA